MKTEIRSLNNTGLATFSSWLEDPSGRAPIQILNDVAFTEAVDGGYMVDLSRTFATSYHFGEYLAMEVFPSDVDRFSLLANAGMWSWLSLAFINSLLKKGGVGAGKPLAKPHYILQSPRLAYRLIGRTAWDLVNLHGEAAKIALGSLRSPWGEMAEQMTARQEIYAHRSFWPVANALYSAPNGIPKRGATSQRTTKARQDPRNQAGLGGVRRLPLTFKQFERTYNLRKMTDEQILALLPKEYQRWLAS
ncbi:hypothetical protein [Luteimonas sp. YGD11-2]|uniref:hypothetical protein n=1 Tax=Luteimonas sp. YGD11-2 TaxID=2508168 RepID=UPI00100BEB01|nr:hypothetical protein [Luteimonas sp. YGD11-2]